MKVINGGEALKNPHPFPDVMGGVAGEYAALYSRYLESPQAFFFMAFHTCLGWALSNRISIDSETKTPARLYTLLLGESADDRKSTAIDKTTEFFSEAIEGFALCSGVGSAEGLQKRLEESPHLLLCWDEFKQFVSKCRIEAAVLLPMVNSLFEKNRFETRTKTSKVVVENAGLSMLAASTVDTYQQTWSQAFTDIGFNNRLFLVVGHGERKYAFPPPIPIEDKIFVRTELREILRFVGNGLKLGITSDAEAMLQKWYLALEPSVHAKRLDGYALRLMQLFAVNDLKNIIDQETTEKVLKLCDWQLAIRKLNDPIGADNAVARLEQNIIRNLEARGELTNGHLMNWVNARKTGLKFYQYALTNLKDAGLVEDFQDGKKKAFRLVTRPQNEDDDL